MMPWCKEDSIGWKTYLDNDIASTELLKKEAYLSGF